MPESPITATYSPAATSSETAFSTVRSPKRLVTAESLSTRRIVTDGPARRSSRLLRAYRVSRRRRAEPRNAAGVAPPAHPGDSLRGLLALPRRRGKTRRRVAPGKARRARPRRLLLRAE